MNGESLLNLARKGGVKYLSDCAYEKLTEIISDYTKLILDRSVEVMISSGRKILKIEDVFQSLPVYMYSKDLKSKAEKYIPENKTGRDPVISEMMFYQRSVELLLPKTPFRRILKSLIDKDFKITENTALLLQYSLENYISSLITNAVDILIMTDRVTLDERIITAASGFTKTYRYGPIFSLKDMISFEDEIKSLFTPSLHVAATSIAEDSVVQINFILNLILQELVRKAFQITKNKIDVPEIEAVFNDLFLGPQNLGKKYIIEIPEDYLSKNVTKKAVEYCNIILTYICIEILTLAGNAGGRELTPKMIKTVFLEDPVFSNVMLRLQFDIVKGGVRLDIKSQFLPKK